MTIIEASSAGVKDMADGTLRITFEFSPTVAAEAYALFGPRGRAVAVAALKDGHAAIPPAPPAERVGPLCLEAAKLCAMPSFWAWINSKGGLQAETPEDAAAFVRTTCQVISRRELDTEPYAADLFRTEIRVPFMKYTREGRA